MADRWILMAVSGFLGTFRGKTKWPTYFVITSHVFRQPRRSSRRSSSSAPARSHPRIGSIRLQDTWTWPYNLFLSELLSYSRRGDRWFCFLFILFVFFHLGPVRAQEFWSWNTTEGQNIYYMNAGKFIIIYFQMTNHLTMHVSIINFLLNQRRDSIVIILW